jgi:hypothetical protein
LFAAITGEDAGGVWSGPVAGVYTYTVAATSPCTGNDVSKVTVTYTPNTLCGNYTGDVFANTNSQTSGGTATVTLSFAITGDLAAACKSLAGLTPADFSITKSAADPNNTNVSIGAITYNNGIVSALATITLPSNAYSASVEFTLSSNNPKYILGTCTDRALVTVSTRVDGFVTGGGYILQNATGGNKGGPLNDGYKNNFGFNIKYNKAGTNLQGNWNTIFRRIESGVVHTYQVKSSQASNLVVTQLSATSYRADFQFTGANLKDLTSSSATIASGLTINVVLFDNGEPGGGVDKIYYEVKNGSTTWYKTASNGEPVFLTKGNLQIHTLGAKAASNSGNVSSQVDMTPLVGFNLQALPNPSVSSFTLKVQGDNVRSKMQVRVMDISGRVLQTIDSVVGGQTIQFGSTYRPGVYIVQLIQGSKKKQLKLVKL